MNTMTAFGKIEQCGCCGKDVKKPVFSKRLNMYLGKDCAEAIRQTRLFGAEDAKRNYPRSWARIVELSK